MKRFKQYLEENCCCNECKLIDENIYRIGSEKYFDFWKEKREQFKEGKYKPTGFDKVLMEGEIGNFAEYEGSVVPLDCPMMYSELSEKKDVKLNEPKRGGSKKYYVYVKNDKGNVVKVEFGDTTGLQAKIDDPEARKAFVKRHDCKNKKDKTKPGWWSCRLPMYSKQLGLSGGGNFFWGIMFIFSFCSYNILHKIPLFY